MAANNKVEEHIKAIKDGSPVPVKHSKEISPGDKGFKIYSLSFKS